METGQIRMMAETMRTGAGQYRTQAQNVDNVIKQWINC